MNYLVVGGHVCTLDTATGCYTGGRAVWIDANIASNIKRNLQDFLCNWGKVKNMCSYAYHIHKLKKYYSSL